MFLEYIMRIFYASKYLLDTCLILQPNKNYQFFFDTTGIILIRVNFAQFRLMNRYRVLIQYFKPFNKGCVMPSLVETNLFHWFWRGGQNVKVQTERQPKWRNIPNFSSYFLPDIKCNGLNVAFHVIRKQSYSSKHLPFKT